jgi:ADP-heptose:LPS heptosyltransferase
MDRGEHVASGSGATLVRTARLRDAVALVATADFVFTPDTSIAHAAAALGRPCVAMYVAGSVTRWGLYPPSDITCSVEHPEPTLTTLAVPRMLAAVDEVWDRARLKRTG